MAAAARADEQRARDEQRRRDLVQKLAEAAAQNDRKRLDAEMAYWDRMADMQMKQQMRNVEVGLKIRREEAAARVAIAKQQARDEQAALADAHERARIREQLNFVDTSGGGWGVLSRMLSGAGRGLQGIMSGVAGAFTDAMKGAIDWVGRTLQITLGMILRDIAWGFVRAIQDGIQGARDAVAGTERTLGSLTTQGMIENQANGMSQADAIKAAREEAFQYLQVIRKLAVYSPFQQEDIQNIYKTFAAYGLGRNEALALTRGMTDLSSAFFVTGERAQSASLAIAQILSRGRATGEEIRQLVNSGVPLMVKLAEKLHITTQELSTMATQGELTSDVMVPALKEIFKEFEGAGKRASMETFTGLWASLADIGPILLQEFFGPINAKTGEMQGLFGALIPVLQDVVEFFTSDRTISTVRNWGIALGKAAENAFAWTRNAFTWGYNLMVEYGNGIIAAASYVIDSLANIADAITSWLIPHSPPRILPDIDKWGKETMEQWLAGFTQADANKVFSSLSSELGGLMRSVFKPIGKDADKTILPQMLMGLNDAVGDLVIAYSQGSGIAQAQARITSMFAGAAPVVNDYVTALLNAQTASEAVAAAEANLANVTKYYQDRLAAIDAQIKSLQNTQKDIGDDVEIRKLNLIINSQFVSAERRAQAQARLQELGLTKQKRALEEERDVKVAAAQASLDAAKVEEQKRNEQLAAAKALLDFYQMQNDLLNEQETALSKLADAAEKLAKAGGAGGGAGALKAPTWGNPREAENKSKQDWNPFGAWQDKLTEFQTKWNELFDKIQERWETFKNSYIGQVVTGVNPTTATMAAVTESTTNRMVDAFEGLDPDIKNALHNGMVAPVAEAYRKFLNDFNGIILASQLFKLGMTVIFSTLGTGLAQIITIANGILTGNYEETFKKIKEQGQGWHDDMVRIAATLVQETEAALGPWYTNLVTGFTNAFTDVKNAVTLAMYETAKAVQDKVNSIIDMINTAITAYNSLPGPDMPTIPRVTIVGDSAPLFDSAPSQTTKTETTTNNTTNYNLGVSTNDSGDTVLKSFVKMKSLTML